MLFGGIVYDSGIIFDISRTLRFCWQLLLHLEGWQEFYFCLCCILRREYIASVCARVVFGSAGIALIDFLQKMTAITDGSVIITVFITLEKETSH